MKKQYDCTDGYCVERLSAASASDAADQYMHDYDWGTVEESVFADIVVIPVHQPKARECFRFYRHPPEPQCTDADGHDWQGVGGCDENPGVFGVGGNHVVLVLQCERCGVSRREDTSAVSRDGRNYSRVTYDTAFERGRETNSSNQKLGTAPAGGSQPTP